jgi:hypothetical protein
MINPMESRSPMHLSRRCAAKSKRQEPAELVTPRLFDLPAEVGGRHAVSFVADDEVPLGRGGDLRLKLVGPGHHVETDDQPIALGNGVAAERGLNLVARQEGIALG